MEEAVQKMQEMTFLFFSNSTDSVNASKKFLEQSGLLQMVAEGTANFDPLTQNILIAMFCLLICIGAFGNCLVVAAVIRKPQMRTARNLFIVNLAMSDLILCLFTMPFTLATLLHKDWILGPFMCKFVRSIQATNVFVSTISITAIALDRYQVIVYPTKECVQKLGSLLLLAGIWMFSFLLATPMFIYHEARQLSLWLHKTCKESCENCMDCELPIDSTCEDCQVDIGVVCAENWPITYGGLVFTCAMLVCQYVLPILIVSCAYARICHRLEYRMVTHVSSTKDQRRREIETRRTRRTNQLLIAVAAVFALSWLPLNIFNMIMFYFAPSSSALGIESGQQYTIFAVCYMMAMSSACSNPLLYGWLNDNFRKEFNDILCQNACAISVKRLCLKTADTAVPMVIYTKANDVDNINGKNHNSVVPDSTTVIPDSSGNTQTEHLALSAAVQ